MSDTPKTDAAIEWARPCGNDSAPPNEQYVSADFARELERELNEWKHALSGWGGTPAIIDEWIKGQQARIYAAQITEARLRELVRVKDEALGHFITAEESFRKQSGILYPSPDGDQMSDAYDLARAALAQTEQGEGGAK